jgi:hypothetical protein
VNNGTHGFFDLGAFRGNLLVRDGFFRVAAKTALPAAPT